jgi:(S)-citramalyl-CoA lyase
MFPKAVSARPDIVCVDLEDAIAPPHKESARSSTIGLFAGLDAPQQGDPELLVRINSPRTPDGIADLHAILTGSSPLPGLMLPKVKSPDEVRALEELLEAAGHDTRFQVIIETNEGLEACHEIARASERIDSLLFGAIDMAAELRVAPTWSALLHARSRLVHAAAGAGIDLIDVPYLELDNLEGLAEASRLARDLGMTGKGAIHPKQLEVITRTFTPTAEEVDEARAIVDAFEAQDRGLLVVNGRLVEKPVILRMQRILAAAGRMAS